MTSRAVAPLLALVLAALLAPAAHAATARVVPVEQGISRSGPIIVPVVEFAAAAGEQNRLTAATSAAAPSTVTLRDTGADIEPGTGCTRVNPREVSCTGTGLRIDAGDRDDRVTLTGLVLSGATAVLAGPGDDTVEGSEGFNTIDGGGGRDTLRGNGGTDELVDGDTTGAADGDTLDGGEGADTLSYAPRAAGVTVDLALRGPAGEPGEGDTVAGIENLTGGQGPDVLVGDDLVNDLDGGAGNDRVDGRGADDRVEGGTGDDVSDGGDGNDVVLGIAGRDEVRGGAGNDDLGGGGDSVGDVVIGGDGDDQLGGSDGDDVVTGDAGDDRFKGSPGADRVAGGLGDDRLSGGTGADRLSGDAGADRLSGGSGADVLSGGSGRDTIIARDRRRDRVNGGSGRDTAKLDRGRVRDRVRSIERRLR